MLTEPQQPPLLDLLTCCGNQPVSHILQHHRLQGEASSPLSPLDKRAPTQPIHGFQHLSVRQRVHQHREQVSDAYRLAHGGQPAQHPLLQRGEPRPLLLQEPGNAAKDDGVLREERLDLPIKEVDDGLGHNIQGQRVARVHFL